MERLFRASKNVQVTLVCHTTCEVINASQRRTDIRKYGPLKGIHVEHVSLSNEFSVHVLSLLDAESATAHKDE